MLWHLLRRLKLLVGQVSILTRVIWQGSSLVLRRRVLLLRELLLGVSLRLSAQTVPVHVVLLLDWSPRARGGCHRPIRSMESRMEALVLLLRRGKGQLR